MERVEVESKMEGGKEQSETCGMSNCKTISTEQVNTGVVDVENKMEKSRKEFEGCGTNECQTISIEQVITGAVDVENDVEGYKPEEKTVGLCENQKELTDKKSIASIEVENKGEEGITKLEEPGTTVIQVANVEVNEKQKLETEHPRINILGESDLTLQIKENDNVVFALTESVRSLENDLDVSRNILENSLLYQELEFLNENPDTEYLLFLAKIITRMMQQVSEYEEMVINLRSKLSSAKKHRRELCEAMKILKETETKV